MRKGSLVTLIAYMKINRVQRLAISLSIISLYLLGKPVTAVAAEGEPEIVASAWSEDTDHFACVTLNGRELLRFKEAANEVAVEDRAEDIAAKLDQLVKNKKFSAEKLYPVKTKDGVVLKIDGTDLFKLSASDLANSVNTSPVKQTFINVDQATVKSDAAKSLLADSKALESKSFEYGLKITNSIREAFGAKSLPISFLKLAELTARHSVDSLSAMASAGASATSRFSGTASWYGPHFHGHKTSDGTIYDQNGMTAAHRSLPFGTKLLVMNRRTGDSCVVKVNDRGPFIGGRVIDLSKGAARQLNMLGSGVAMVDCIVLGKQ